MLSVTVGHGHDLRADGYELTARLLSTPAALRTDRERDLIARPAVVTGAAQDVARHQQQRGVVVEAGAAAAPQLVHGLAKERERFRRHFEAEHVGPGRVMAWRRWLVARSLAGHERFELVRGFAAGDREPLALGLGDGNTGELADARPVERAFLERLSDDWQPLERLGNAQLLLGRAGLVAEQPLDVLGKAAKAQVYVRGCTHGREQPASLLRVCRSALSGEPR